MAHVISWAKGKYMIIVIRTFGYQYYKEIWEQDPFMGGCIAHQCFYAARSPICGSFCLKQPESETYKSPPDDDVLLFEDEDSAKRRLRKIVGSFLGSLNGKEITGEIYSREYDGDGDIFYDSFDAIYSEKFVPFGRDCFPSIEFTIIEYGNDFPF